MFIWMLPSSWMVPLNSPNLTSVPLTVKPSNLTWGWHTFDGRAGSLMAAAGATHVVVMARAHEETIKCVVKAGRDHGIKVMGDNLGCPDMVAGAKFIEDLGCDFVVHHIGYDERRGIAATPYRIALAWNSGIGAVLSGRPTSAAEDYASRAANLATEFERLELADSR